jgi:hypothetical protein
LLATVQLWAAAMPLQVKSRTWLPPTALALARSTQSALLVAGV